jgi:hypothetical protein
MSTNSTRSRHGFVVLLVTVLVLSGSAQAPLQLSNEVIWQQFLEWMPSAPPIDGPRIVFNRYRSRLISNGASAAEADRHMAVVQRFHRERLASLSLATATKGRLKPDPGQPSDKYLTKSPLGYDREQVEVLARSNTFPSVLNLGELMLSVEYPNSTLFCLDAAYYAGKAQGLIWAMDRDTVIEHGLQWTIDNAKDLFDTCLSILLRADVAGQNANDNNQADDVKEILSGQIRLIQQKLAYGRDLKIVRK